jgi:hypothetical protein
MTPTTQEPAATTALYAVATIPPGRPLPTPWYSADHDALDCELCRDVVDELWPLLDYPPDPDAALSPGELCVCRRCAEAVRPGAPAIRQPAA